MGSLYCTLEFWLFNCMFRLSMVYYANINTSTLQHFNTLFTFNLDS